MNPTPLPPPQGVMAPKVGDRVTHVLGTNYDPACITPGDSGTVLSIDGDGDVNVQRDNPKDARFGGDWYIEPASLKPYERTYSEAEYSALLARCEGLEADARRYRWLRDPPVIYPLPAWIACPNESPKHTEGPDWLTGESADIAIDAALAATRTTGDNA